jgi:hypothetical protein
LCADDKGRLQKDYIIGHHVFEEWERQKQEKMVLDDDDEVNELAAMIEDDMQVYNSSK